MGDEAGMRLIEASMDGDVAAMASAVRDGASVAFQDPGGQTALFWAAMEGHGEALEWLVARGASVDATNEGGQTALMGAAMRCVVKRFCPTVRSRSCHYTHGSRQPYSAISVHSSTGDTCRNETAMLKRLIDSGANVNHQDFSGQTAFAWAASNDAADSGVPARTPVTARASLSACTHA